ncbi:MAG: hypothetical protein H6551_12055 [Chitinophagales bacterium]|nr:hypothetical protein [Chitinophagaceae bacterium]MCB9065862.1 hypothetical protein [Chitinophagales bacterium]
MSELKFKTNINCGGCVKAVSGTLNCNLEIESWNVDVTNPDKILTVKTNTLSPEQVVELINNIGFVAKQAS